MKKKRIICLVAFLALIITVTAQTPSLRKASTVNIDDITFNTKNVLRGDSTKAAAMMSIATKTAVNNARAMKTKARRSAAVGSGWSESFEAWPGAEAGGARDYFWLPEGWTRKATEAYMTPENPHTWFVNTQANEYVPAPVDGKVYAEIIYNREPQDEWLYTPELQPSEGDWLQYWVTFFPFTMYDYSKYDYKTDTFTEYITVGNLQTYISVDGGEYQLIADLAEEYKTADVHEISDLYHNGYITNKKVSIDMAPYIGHNVKIGFRYVGNDGDSMWLDAISMDKPEMTVSYDIPESALFLGMPMDMSDPKPMLFLPDNTPLTWLNTSSLEAQTFTWKHASANDYSAQTTSTATNLMTQFNAFKEEKVAEDILANIASSPLLHADGIAGLTGDYTYPIPNIKIGGKAYNNVNGTIVNAGATTCNPTHGIKITTTESGYPLFGYQRDADSPWTPIFGLGADDEAHVSAVINQFPKPAKTAKVRGMWIQGVGNLASPARLKAGAFRKNVYGSLDEEPVAVAILDVENIHKEAVPGAEGMYYYSLPFVFADPLEVKETLWYKLDGIDKAFKYFAPLQDDEPSDIAHGYIDISYTYGGEKGVNTYSIGNLILSGVPCNNSFFINLDMAYGDCDDWKHIDINPLEPEMPEISVGKDAMHLINLDGDENLERQLPMRCGFYKKDADVLRLYPVIGELYTYEGGPFYTDDLSRTYYFEIIMPQSMVGTEQAISSESGISVRYYDIIREEWMVNATSGTVKITEKANGTYAIELKALDSGTYNAVAMNYDTNDTWRWREYGEMRPNPNVHKLSRGGKDYEICHLNSCVIDNSDENTARLYFCTTPNVTTVEGMQHLPADDNSLVVIEMTKERMNGNFLSFSMTRNNPALILDIHYNGEVYNSSRTDIDGGNACVEYDAATKHIDATSMLFTLPSPMIDGGYPNWSLKYNGTYSEDNGIDGITEINNEGNASDTICTPSYNLAGQRINGSAKGIIIVKGKKYIK